MTDNGEAVELCSSRFPGIITDRSHPGTAAGELVNLNDQIRRPRGETALCNSRKCRLKHIQRHKKYNGIRIYSINESTSGYTWSFIVDTKDGTSAPEFAMKLCEQLPGVWHRVYMDNAFPQVRNLEKMYDMNDLEKMYDIKVYGAGTMRPHFGFPPELHELVRKLNDKNSPLDVGEYEWMMAPLGDNREASFLAVVWRDVGYVKFISTFHSPKEVLIFKRQPGMINMVESRNLVPPVPACNRCV